MTNNDHTQQSEENGEIQKKGSVSVRQLPIVVFLLLVALFVMAFVSKITSDLDLSERKLMLEQLGAALNVYANESRGGKYPPKAAERGVFTPDMAALEEYLPEGEDGEKLAAYLKGEGSFPVIYLGYAVQEQKLTMSVLDALEEDDSGHARHRDIKTPYSTQIPHSTAYRLREGIERFFITDICNPASDTTPRSYLPVAWELPPLDYDEPVLVLYMDGSVRQRQLPETFPYEQNLTTRFRRILRGERETLSDHIMPEARSIRQIASDIVYIAKPEARSKNKYRVLSCDMEPSVKIDGHAGYRIIAGRPVVSNVELVLFPASPDISGDTKKRLQWEKLRPGKDLGETFDLGEAKGFRWFGKITWDQERLITNYYRLEGGDDRYLEYSKWFKKNEVPERSAIKEKLDKLPESMHLSHLDQLCNNPRSAREFAAAFRIRRELENRPYSDELLCARSALIYEARSRRNIKITHRPLSDGAKQVFRETSDQEAAAVIALGFAPATRGGCGNSSKLREVGRQILRDIWPELRNPIIEHLANNLQDAYQREQYQRLLEELEREDISKDQTP